jgi:hypothetical protein
VRSAVQFVPIATTILALVFSTELYRRWRQRGGRHHLWFCIGGLTYAAGTITESLTTLFGWSDPVFRAWYVTGALLGGAPLAQGSAYLHLSRNVADRLSIGLVAVVLIASAFVLSSPVNLELVEPYRLTGRVLDRSWVRAFSPFLNTYALAFLVGGAVVSAARYAKDAATRNRSTGNVLIAIGAVLPGIGGSFTRFGFTEVLYVTEFIGLILIYAGYRLAIAPSARAGGQSVSPGRGALIGDGERETAPM